MQSFLLYAYMCMSVSYQEQVLDGNIKISVFSLLVPRFFPKTYEDIIEIRKRSNVNHVLTTHLTI
jgi:hypothetical protein